MQLLEAVRPEKHQVLDVICYALGVDESSQLALYTLVLRLAAREPEQYASIGAEDSQAIATNVINAIAETRTRHMTENDNLREQIRTLSMAKQECEAREEELRRAYEATRKRHANQERAAVTAQKGKAKMWKLW